jgi:hypothetical protein
MEAQGERRYSSYSFTTSAVDGLDTEARGKILYLCRRHYAG